MLIEWITKQERKDKHCGRHEGTHPTHPGAKRITIWEYLGSASVTVIDDSVYWNEVWFPSVSAAKEWAQGYCDWCEQIEADEQNEESP